MAWLLDTNAIIALMTRRSDNLIRRIDSKVPGTIFVSTIVRHELYFGVYGSQRVESNLETLRLMLSDFKELDFDSEDARAAGEIRAALKRIGQPIGPYDVLIAGQARARGLTLVTNNVGEFSRIEDLDIEDWTLG